MRNKKIVKHNNNIIAYLYNISIYIVFNNIENIYSCFISYICSAATEEYNYTKSIKRQNATGFTDIF